MANHNITTASIAIALASALIACSTTDEEISLITPCEFSDGAKAPPWVCNEDAVLELAQLKDITWATGQAKKMRAGKSLQKKAAILDGRSKLLEQISVRVESLLQQQAQGSNTEDAIEQFVQSFSEGILVGSRNYSTATDRGNGELYVIVGITDAQFKKNVEGNKQYQELREAILAGGGKATARRIDKGLDRISQAKRNMGLEGARKIANERDL